MLPSYMYCLEWHFVVSLPYLGVKAKQYLVRLLVFSMFLDKKT